MAERNDKQRSIRLPSSLWGRVDGWIEDFNQANPGIAVTHSDAIRTLLTRALDAEDQRKEEEPVVGKTRRVQR